MISMTLNRLICIIDQQMSLLPFLTQELTINSFTKHVNQSGTCSQVSITEPEIMTLPASTPLPLTMLKKVMLIGLLMLKWNIHSAMLFSMAFLTTTVSIMDSA